MTEGTIVMGIKTYLTAAGIIVLGATAAGAADLAPLPPPPAPPPMEFAGNWYIRGDVGVASYSTGHWSQPVTLGAGETLDASGFLSKSIQEPAFIDGGVGYQFNEWFRADVTAEYRTAIGMRGVFYEQTHNTGAGTVFYGQNQYPGTLQSSLFMANAYADLGTWHGISPYIGAGIGLVRHSMSGFTDSGYAWNGTALVNGYPNGPLTPVANSIVSDKTKTNLAWALMAGLSYSITPNLKLDIGYRYLNMGDVESGTVNCLCGQTFAGFKAKELTSNEVKLGMRWIIGDVGPIAPEYPEPAPGPIVRKY
jgi:opacity protein-like surface antigen